MTTSDIQKRSTEPQQVTDANDVPPPPPPMPEVQKSSGSSSNKTTGQQQKQQPSKKDKGLILASRYKTKMCQKRLDGQKCPYQVRCMFAHSEAELRTKEQNLAEGITSEEAINAHRFRVQEEKKRLYESGQLGRRNNGNNQQQPQKQYQQPRQQQQGGRPAYNQQYPQHPPHQAPFNPQQAMPPPPPPPPMPQAQAQPRAMSPPSSNGNSASPAVPEMMHLRPYASHPQDPQQPQPLQQFEPAHGGLMYQSGNPRSGHQSPACRSQHPSQPASGASSPRGPHPQHSHYASNMGSHRASLDDLHMGMQTPQCGSDCGDVSYLNSGHMSPAQDSDPMACSTNSMSFGTYGGQNNMSGNHSGSPYGSPMSTPGGRHGGHLNHLQHPDVGPMGGEANGYPQISSSVTMPPNVMMGPGAGFVPSQRRQSASQMAPNCDAASETSATSPRAYQRHYGSRPETPHQEVSGRVYTHSPYGAN